MEKCSVNVNFIIKMSGLLTIGRGLLLPFFVLFLRHHYHLSVQQIGFFISLSVIASLAIGLFGGYLCDRYSSSLLISASLIIYALASISLTVFGSLLALLISLSLFHAAFAVFDIAIKALISGQDDKKAYSRLYIYNSIGWAIGGAIYWAIPNAHLYYSFIASTIITVTATGLLTWHFYHVMVFHPQKYAGRYLNPIVFLKKISCDKSLCFFVIGCFFMGMVFKGFIHWLAMYFSFFTELAVSKDIISTLVVTNSLTIIISQNVAVRLIKFERQHYWRNLMTSIILLALGTICLLFCGVNLSWLILSTFIFTFGEVLIVLMEFYFIDYIAPANHKGGYYSMQNFSNLCFLISPSLIGIAINHFGRIGLLTFLLTMLVISLLFFSLSIKSITASR